MDQDSIWPESYQRTDSCFVYDGDSGLPMEKKTSSNTERLCPQIWQKACPYQQPKAYIHCKFPALTMLW